MAKDSAAPVVHSEGKPPDEAKGSAEKAAEAVEKRGLEPELVKLPKEAAFAISDPPEASLSFIEREPDKVIPVEGSDGADTPSGYALRQVGAPDPTADRLSERERGLQYRVAKYVKRWLG